MPTIKLSIASPAAAAARASAVAQLIKKDKGGCLSGGGLHSMACGDGDYCENERLLRAKALAEYFLAHKS